MFNFQGLPFPCRMEESLIARSSTARRLLVSSHGKYSKTSIRSSPRSNRSTNLIPVQTYSVRLQIKRFAVEALSMESFASVQVTFKPSHSIESMPCRLRQVTSHVKHRAS